MVVHRMVEMEESSDYTVPPFHDGPSAVLRNGLLSLASAVVQEDHLQREELLRGEPEAAEGYGDFADAPRKHRVV